MRRLNVRARPHVPDRHARHRGRTQDRPDRPHARRRGRRGTAIWRCARCSRGSRCLRSTRAHRRRRGAVELFRDAGPARAARSSAGYRGRATCSRRTKGKGMMRHALGDRGGRRPTPRRRLLRRASSSEFVTLFKSPPGREHYEVRSPTMPAARRWRRQRHDGALRHPGRRRSLVDPRRRARRRRSASSPCSRSATWCFVAPRRPQRQAPARRARR